MLALPPQFHHLLYVQYNLPHSDNILMGDPYIENDSNHFSITLPLDIGYNKFRITLLKDTGDYRYKLMGSGSFILNKVK